MSELAGRAFRAAREVDERALQLDADTWAAAVKAALITMARQINDEATAHARAYGRQAWDRGYAAGMRRAANILANEADHV